LTIIWYYLIHSCSRLKMFSTSCIFSYQKMFNVVLDCLGII
jgi:hypothetical protein